MDTQLRQELTGRLLNRGFSLGEVEAFFHGVGGKKDGTGGHGVSGRPMVLREDEMYRFIVDYKKAHDGNSPSIREIVQACESVSSTSQGYAGLLMLESQGLIRMNGVRQIEVVGGTWLLKDRKVVLDIDYDLL